MKRYPAYKDSGVQWLGEIPAHWNLLRLKYAAKVNPSKTEISGLPKDLEVSFIPMELVGNGELFLEQKKSLSDIGQGFTYFRNLDVIVAKITPCFENGKGAIALGLENGIGFGTTELHVLRAKEIVQREFLYYLTISYPFRAAGTVLMRGTAGQKRVPDDFISNFLTPLPPPKEQGPIVAFLNRNLSEIDRYIANKQQQIELLQERKNVTVRRVVTHGLNPDALLKPSGLDWLGDIPSHWEIRKTKYLFKMVVDNAPENNSEELLSLYTEIGVRPRKQLEERGNRATTTDGYLRVKDGDIIVNKLLAWMGAIGVSHYEGVTSPAYDVLRNTAPLNPDYYDYLFRCGLYLPEFRRRSRGIMDMRLRLYFDEFGQILLPYPPEHEQTEIVNYIRSHFEESDQLIEQTLRQIELIQEYRFALISEAVTGKMDLR